MWAQVCKLDINAAIAYLILASGTGPDNQQTSWSVNAVMNYGNLTLKRAQRAIQLLCKEKFIKQLTTGPHPKYELLLPKKPDKEDWIWLPNTLVAGAKREKPPIVYIRESGDKVVLQLLVELYGAHQLTEDGGIDRAILWQNYKRLEVGTSRQHRIWAFVPTEGITISRVGLFSKYVGDKKVDLDNLWKRINLLFSLGLLQWIPHLFESAEETGQPIHAYGIHNTNDVEDRLGAAAAEAAITMVTEKQLDRASACLDHTPLEELLLAPLPKHMLNVQMVGIARLRYRPQTKLTSAWWGDLNQKAPGCIEGYKKLATEAYETRKSGGPLRRVA
jgi:hypothetical protein